MKIFDFNIHFPSSEKNSTEYFIASELQATDYEISQRVANSNYKVEGANIMIFNPNINDFSKIRKASSNKFKKHLITQLVNPNDYEKNISSLDIDAIKFHAYHQNITSDQYDRILQICLNSNKIIAIDTSYGSSKMYMNKPLELASLIVDQIKDKPIILLHSGGAKCMEALLLAESQDNVFLETSFTYNYYFGSSISHDLNFIYNKLGADKIIFGSDSPYCDLSTQLIQINKVLDDIGFDEYAKSKVFYKNALSLI